jgi:hypothetical protein
MSIRALLAVLFALLLSCAALSQNQIKDQPKLAPLPYDPFELATGPTVIPDTPQKRDAMLGLLEHARQNNGMHAPGSPAFAMKVSFNSTGASRYTGFGEMEETWMSPGTFRWSARLGDYSQLRIYSDGAAYDDKPRGPIPLRIQMVRQSVFWPVTGRFAPALIRMATANWQGAEVACMLISGSDNDATATPGRRLGGDGILHRSQVWPAAHLLGSTRHLQRLRLLRKVRIPWPHFSAADFHRGRRRDRAADSSR